MPYPDLTGPALGGGISVTGAEALPGVADAVASARSAGLPAALVAKDATLWGPDAQPEASIRLGWLDLAETSRPLLEPLAALRRELRSEHLDHIVLAGMGGSSLAAEVITRTLGVELTVLDTTDPHLVRATLADRIERTVVVVASKSGSTLETDAHRRAAFQAFLDAGLTAADAGRRFVVVTDPGSPLETLGTEMGARKIFLADPNVGGRYSALSAFGLVPAALAGADVEPLLDEARELATDFGPALVLGAALASAAAAGKDKLVLAEDGSGIAGLASWIEQLIAESTGKQGRGILPIAVEGPLAPGTHGPDVLWTTVGGALGNPGDIKPDLTVNGPLGAQFLAWEYATAVAGHELGINPFDQPNVQESKDNTARILEHGLPHTTPAFVDDAIEVYGELVEAATDVKGAIAALLGTSSGYLAVMAYLDRVTDAEVAQVRAKLAARTDRPVTFGWGPRLLHSTGQYFKGGPQNGAFLQLTGAVANDLPVPGKEYTFGTLQAAQAAGDLQALGGRGRPIVRLHLTDRAAGLAQLLEAVR
jgi:glucose-6-phosphate isomerase